MEPSAPVAATLPVRQQPAPVQAVSTNWIHRQQRHSEDVVSNAHERICLDPDEAAALAFAYQAIMAALDFSEVMEPRIAAIQLRRQLGEAKARIEWLMHFDRAENRNHVETYAISRRMTAEFGNVA